MKTKTLSLIVILLLLGVFIVGCTITPEATEAPTAVPEQPVD